MDYQYIQECIYITVHDLRFDTERCYRKFLGTDLGICFVGKLYLTDNQC